MRARVASKVSMSRTLIGVGGRLGQYLGYSGGRLLGW